MTADGLFRICNSVALLAWILLVGLGWKRWVSGLVTGVLVPVLLAVAYLSIVITQWGQGGDFNSLQGVATLFSNRWMLLAGWIHYLAFDLFIGSWETRNAARLGIRHWFVAPCLLLTFLFGPVGLLLYLAMRFAIRRRFAVTEEAEGSARPY